ncbi:MAG: geranylgeranylglycerol-phosphate geranylgeranyltransferase [Bacteroidetes bacterium]|nr:geranylgeranylglycerol-phosphate geranylgeranyltransferase [Bacteroidota bacterium]
MPVLSRANRVRLVKFLAFLSIIRWPIVLFVAMAQYLVAFFVCNHLAVWQTVLFDTKVHLIVLSSVCIISAGFIINSFYDLEKDLVNRPHKTLFNRVISKSFCLYVYFALNLIGLMVSAFGSLNILIFFTAFVFGLWFYSHKLQKIPLIRELSASLLGVAAVFAIGLHYNVVNKVLIVYAAILMTIIFNREMVKDFRNFEGDRVAGNDTMVVFLGKRSAYWLHLALSLVTILLTLVFTTYSSRSFDNLYAGLMITLHLIAAVLLIQHTQTNRVRWAHRTFKLLLILSTFYLVFL